MRTTVIHGYDIRGITSGLRAVNRWNTFVRVSTTDRIKRRKPANSRKESHLRVRLAEPHMAEIQTAAVRAGISLSAWVTERLLKCARQESRQEKQESRHD